MQITTLSIAQQNAIDLLITGISDREVAEKVGVARQTVTSTFKNRQVTDAAEIINQEIPDELPPLFEPSKEDEREARRRIFKRLQDSGGVG